MISSVAIRSPRKSLLARLVASIAGDIAAYRDGLVSDLRGLLGDAVSAGFATLVVLSQLVDALTTLVALANNGAERNPLSAAVISHWGLLGLLGEKVMISCVVVVNMARLRGRSGRALGLVAAVIGISAAVWNLHVIG